MNRQLTGGIVLIAVLMTVSFFALTQGAFPLSAGQFGQVLLGKAPQAMTRVVLDWRLPRVCAAMVTGAALALSGAIFQSLLRNPLGSPDVLGFNTGAFSAVLLMMVFLPGDPGLLALAALTGGLLTALTVYLFAWRKGINTFRLILVGIGIRALLMSLNSWLVTTTSLDTALSAGLWSAGSLNGVSWQKLLPVTGILIPVAVLAGLMARRMRLLEMGDEMAVALGVPAERSRMILLILGVILTAVCTALIGPVSFIALVAPQIAARFTSGRRDSLALSMLCGAALMLTADYLATHLFGVYQLPVGVVTVCLGGIYLMSLLIRETRYR